MANYHEPDQSITPPPPPAGSSWASAAAARAKSASALAAALQVPFLEGDAFHSPANVAKMAAGIPLDDADRADWLLRLQGRNRRRRAPAAKAWCCPARR